ncbi:hypothetical protein Q5O89_09890 [Peribacillus frigoritolerans]|nr:hypothetical protein [Peribacillus frigoritolerans]
MSYSLQVSKWFTAIVLIGALLTAFIFSPANASASINYGDEVAALAKKQVGSKYKYGGRPQKGLMLAVLPNMYIKMPPQK